MKPKFEFQTFLIFLSALLLCSCVAPIRPAAILPATELPVEVVMNPDAGRGMWVFATLRLEDGEALPFFIDTGSSDTLLDKSLESKLGESRGTGTQFKFARYEAPRLYSGKTRLMMGRYVLTSDLKHLSIQAGRPIMGVLGMDCLCHYCIQLDFAAGKIRFLEPEQTDATSYGKAFPLKLVWGCPFIKQDRTMGGDNDRMLVDTGFLSDDISEKSTDSARLSGSVHLAEFVWDHETYKDVDVQFGRVDEVDDILGLGFLARHLVTLDFPKGLIYLNRKSEGPLVDEELVSARKFLKDLKAAGKQPGWSKEDQGDYPPPEEFPNSFIFHMTKDGDSSVYNYTIYQASADSPWKLQKAWRTDKTGRLIEAYP